jgi:hypothetical protein
VIGQEGINLLSSDTISTFCLGVNPTTEVTLFKMESASEQVMIVENKRGSILLPQAHILCITGESNDHF